jgi:hypothetical protein
MEIILVILALVFIAALGLHAYKRLRHKREERMGENEYSAAVTLWNYGRTVKSQIEETMRQRTGVIDFYKITVPHSPGYRVSLELAGYRFRIYAVPERYNRTGRLSFYIDDRITVRALDRGGQPASQDDPEYQGEAAAYPAH